MANQVYAIVTDRVLELLERGVVPWRRPWRGADVAPQNLVSKRAYRGINPFLLGCTGFASPYWVTYRQAKRLGGHVRKGEKATPVVFWKRWQTERRDPETGETETVEVPILRYYKVFNVEQCEGIDAPALPESADFEPIGRCESIVSAMPKRPTIEHREARAYYRPSADTVNMPRPELFVGSEEYYSTLFHELTHSTGHRSRLGRPGIENLQPFGSPDYSREELIAEMGAAFLCGHCGIEAATIENSAAYLKGWLRKLRDDHRLVVQAAAQAQKAADYILGQGGAGSPDDDDESADSDSASPAPATVGQAAPPPRRRRPSVRFSDFRPMDARRDSVGCINGDEHRIRKGDRIGWCRRHRLACCAACWQRWVAENREADWIESGSMPCPW